MQSTAGLARALASRGRNAVVRTPPSPTERLRPATIVSVAAEHDICSVTIGTSSQVVTRVQFMRPYVPRVGDNCWVVVKGSSGADVVVQSRRTDPPSVWP